MSEHTAENDATVTTPCPVCGQTFTGSPGWMYQCNGGGSLARVHAYFLLGDGRLLTDPHAHRVIPPVRGES